MSEVKKLTITLFDGALGEKTFEVGEIKSYRGGDFYSVIELKNGCVYYANETYAEINKKLKFYK